MKNLFGFIGKSVFSASIGMVMYTAPASAQEIKYRPVETGAPSISITIESPDLFLIENKDKTLILNARHLESKYHQSSSTYAGYFGLTCQ